MMNKSLREATGWHQTTAMHYPGATTLRRAG
jgi:hypothetical protein